MRSFFHNRLAVPLIDLVRQGITPEKLAWSLALGVCLSCLPVFGITTLLWLFIALGLRLNLPAMLLANWAALPLQVLLFVPFLTFGGMLFRSQTVSLAPTRMMAMLQADPWNVTLQLWSWEWHAIVT